MKKYFIIVALVMLTAFVFSQNNEESIAKINLLAEDNLKKNEALISLEAKKLTQNETLGVYNNLTIDSSDVVFPFALNTLLGFGSGSFVQGDSLGGTIGLTSDIIGYGLVSVPYIAFVSYYGFASLSYLNDDDNASDYDARFKNIGRDAEIVFGSMIAGVSLLLASRVFQVVKPWTYMASFNNRLGDALGIGDVAFNITPLLDIEKGTPHLSASVAIKL